MVRELRGKRGEQVYFPWSVVEPTEDFSYLLTADKDEIPRNLRRLYQRFSDESNFFIESGSDLDKAELIANMAAMFGRKTIEVTLHGDHARALDGNRIACVDSEVGYLYQGLEVPEWAQYIHDRPEEEFVLVFNIDQAAPHLVGALKSIIDRKVILGVKFDNCLVAVSATKGVCQTDIRSIRPLFSLLKPSIECE